MKQFTDNRITIYTPTYNRGYCLNQLYESLYRQGVPYQYFKWIIIDDGSIDNTEEIVNKWIIAAPFKIEYYKQNNEGKMAKLNFVHNILDTEMCVCVDSDDFLVDQALYEVFEVWQYAKQCSDIGGLIGLDCFKNGDIVGTKFPNNVDKIKIKEFKKYGISGDKKIVYRSKLVYEYPRYPSFNGEKFPAPGYLNRLIDQDYDLYIINRPLCVVEYLADGLSKGKFKQFKNAPESFIFYRKERMRLADTYLEKFKNAIHYVSSCIFAKRNFFINNPFIITTLLAIPFGIVLNLYIRKNLNKGVV